MSIPERDFIKAMADNGLVRTRAARAMYVSRNALDYRIAKIKQRTGLDPNDFWDMQKLVKKYNITEGEK